MDKKYKGLVDALKALGRTQEDIMLVADNDLSPDTEEFRKLIAGVSQLFSIRLKAAVFELNCIMKK